MGSRKAISFNIHRFHVLTGPLGQKFHADTKNDLKKFHTISEGLNFSIELSGGMTIQILRTVYLYLYYACTAGRGAP
jgi:hypothetical protein